MKNIQKLSAIKSLVLMMVWTASSAFGEERSAEWKKLNDEAWQTVRNQFPELVASDKRMQQFKDVVDFEHEKLKRDGGGFGDDPLYPIHMTKLLVPKGIEQAEYRPPIAYEPAPAPEPVEKKEPSEWLKKNAHAWQIMRKEFPERFITYVGRDNVVALVREYDREAKINNPELYRDPYKPLYYLRHYEAEKARKEAARKAEIARQEEARRTAPPPRWEEYVTNTEFQAVRRQAMMSDAERQAEEQQQRMDEMQRKIDAANKKLRDIENGTYK